ncbi:MAG: PQQ-like beta-propeller repeat protein, partial [Planctomycetales bacterium]
MSRSTLIFSISLLAFPLLAIAEDWPQWRGPNRDGRASDVNLITDWENNPPKLAWTAEGLGSGYGSVSVVGGKAFVTGNFADGQGVAAINIADGQLIWTTALTDSAPRHSRQGSRSTPTIDGDRAYVVTSDGSVACLKTADGEVVWKRNFKQDWGGFMMSGWGYSESPLIDGDRVLCTPGGPDAMIVALNKMTGEEIWKAATPQYEAEDGKNGKKLKDGAGYSSIVISEAAGVKQYVQLIGRGVVGIRASDGKFLWRYVGVANGTANIPTPIVSGDGLFVSTGYNTGSALLKLSADGDGVKAEEVYFLEGGVLQNKHGGLVLHDGHVYCGHKSGLPICVEMK